MKLEIRNVKFRNFFSYGRVLQEIDFQSGINLVLGNDITKDRSNAVGKSSFLEAIPFALFGKVNRHVRKESIINWKNRKNCEVYLTFSKGGIEYTIMRALKPDKLEVYKNGQLMSTPSHKIDYQKEIESEIIGFDFKTFISLVYSNLNSSVPLLSMTTDKKRKFIETVFGLELYSQLNFKCNEKLKTISDKTFSYKTKRDYIEKNIEEINVQISSLQSQISGISSFETEISDLKKQIDEIGKVNLTEMKSKISVDIQDTTATIGSLTQAKWNDKSNIVVLEERIKTIITDIKKIGRPEEEKKILESTRKKYDVIVKKYGSPEECDAKIRGIDNDINTIETDVSETMKKIDVINKDIIERNVRIKDNSGSIQLLTDVDVCPTCGTLIDSNKISKEKTKQVKTFKKEVDTLEKEKDALRTTLISLNKKKKKLDGERKEIIEKKFEMVSLMSKIEPLKNIEERIQSLASLKQERDNKEAELERLKVYLMDIECTLETLEIELKSLNIQLTDIKKKVQDEKELKNKLLILEEKARGAFETKERLERLVSEYKVKIENLHMESRQTSVQIQKMSGLSDYMEFIKNICRDENVKTYAISSIIPYLNKRMNHYLSEVGHSFYVVLDNWLDADIRGPGIVNCTYGNLSGGEAKSTDFSLQMALLDIARVQAGVWPDVLLMDEILDSSLDSYSIEKVIQIIKLKQQEDDSKIFLVSHRKEVNDIDIDRVYIAEKRDGFSYIRLQ